MTIAADNPFLAGVAVDVAESAPPARSSRTLTITKVERDDAGHWHARVTPPGGVTIPVDRIHGSWQTSTNPRREVMPHIAAALQDKVRPIENAERREREAAAEAAKKSAKAPAASQAVLG